ncbi:MAG: DNA polymerase III subunit [Planctomycetota bacterium]
MAEPESDWPLKGHAAILAGLWRAAAAQRLPHALLFLGPSGVGKFRAARALAQGLLCALGPREIGPCGTCGPCKRFQSGGHPDLLVIDPPREIDELIRIGYIVRREGSGEPEDPADEFLALKPMEGGWRIVILRGAERMVEQAQNALLKMLEEPGANVLWILICDRPSLLLATIRSRVVPVRFASLSAEDAMGVLLEQGLAREDAVLLSRWSGGAPGTAISMGERGVPLLRAVLVSLLCGEVDPFQAATALALVEGRFEGKTPAGRERERARTVLDLATSLLGDLARLRAGLPAASLPHGDLALCAEKIAFAARPALLAAAVESLRVIRTDIELNLDPAQALERAALVLAARDPSQLLC